MYAACKHKCRGLGKIFTGLSLDFNIVKTVLCLLMIPMHFPWNLKYSCVHVCMCGATHTPHEGCMSSFEEVPINEWQYGS